MGYIYKIWNDINDKVYIGQTTQSIQQRWKEHLYNSHSSQNKPRAVYSAMKKYGEELFHIETIEECENEKLDEREVYWVKYYDSYNNGYNMTLGGQYTSTAKGLTKQDSELIKSFWDQGLSVAEIVRKTNFSRTQVRYQLEGYKNYNQDAEERGRLSAAKSKYKSIKQWSQEGELIAIYASGLEAEEKTGISRKAISKALCGKSKTSGGFMWTYADQESICINKTSEQYHIYQYDQQNNLIAKYKTKAEAGRATGLDPSSIGKVCRGIYKTCGGYIWVEE